MTLTELYNTIRDISLSKVEVNSYHTTNPYTALNQNDVRYSAICFEINGCNDTDTYRTYNATIYYANRLTETADNLFLIQNTAVNTISDIIRNISETEGILNVSDNIQYTFFQQKFIDYLSGAYCNINITVPINNCNIM